MMRNKTYGLYVHVPFCRSKCPYCDFYSLTGTELIDEWLEALGKEAELYRGLFPRFDTLYLGGGTPSVLSRKQTGALIEKLRRTYRTAPGAEITIELNPDDVTGEKCVFFREAGINRISLGVQSLDDGDLRFLGRRHNAEQAVHAFESLRLAGFDNIGIDLIYGFDGLTADRWERTLETAASLGPEHISCYQMTIAGGTPFAETKRGGVLGEAEQRSMFLRTSRFLRSCGYIHYEISNFARGERFVSRHNTGYWNRSPYLGLGPSAHSFKDGKRWWNVPSLRRYIDILLGGGRPVDGSELLTGDQAGLEALWLGLRTRHGVDIESLTRYPGWKDTVERLGADSLARVDGERLVPTIEGYLLADTLPLLFTGRRACTSP